MSTDPEDMACRQIHGTSPPLACLFHVLYNNAMISDSDLTSVMSTAPDYPDAEANRPSRLTVSEFVSGSERANVEEV